MFKPILSVSLNCICKEINDDVISILNDSQIGNLELHPVLFPEEGKYSPETFLDKLDKAKAGSLHSPYGRGYDFSTSNKDELAQAFTAFSKSLELADRLNIPLIIVHSSIEPITDEERSMRLRIARESIRKLADICAEKEKRLAIELLPRSCIGNHENELLELTDGLSQRHVGICLDTNHMMSRPDKLPELVKNLGGSLFALHMSDYNGIDEQHFLPGKGVIDWKAFLASLHTIGFPGPLTFECVVPDIPFQSKVREIEKCYAWLISLIQR
ncbi:MAG: hypothetical protein A2X49_13175 [Lentisphaerae bacterium GWF2_52_8]|nr:MAG: hypothetical protein A2X49_13175 [Lentisphaerae bacterium GWF2_52_8]